MGNLSLVEYTLKGAGCSTERCSKASRQTAAILLLEEIGYSYAGHEHGQLRSKGPAMAGGSARFREKEGRRRRRERGEGKAAIWIAATIYAHIGRGRSPRKRGRKWGERACTVNTHVRRYGTYVSSGIGQHQAEQSGACAFTFISSTEWKQCCAML